MYQGRTCKVDWGCCLNGKKPAKSFMDGLTQAEQIKLSHILQKLLDEGKVWNEQKFKKLEGPIWELKSDMNRLLCFKHGDCWVLTNGFKKDRQKTERKYIDLAVKVMTEHIQRSE